MARKIEDMRNLGPATAQMLREIGIHDEDGLRETGAVAAYVRLRFVHGRRISLNALYAMHASLTDRDWRQIAPEEKKRLRAEAG